jgi:heavy metal efflux system protein
MEASLEKWLREFPEVESVFARTGVAKVATDPMPPNISDTYIMLRPRKEWPDPGRPKEDLVNAMAERIERLPGSNYEFTQPIEMRFNELLAGVRADMAVKVFGDDMEVLRENAEQIAAVLRTVPGAADVRVEQVTGLPVLTIQMKREALARYGLNVADVQEVVEAAMGGKVAGKIYEGDRRFDLAVRLPEAYRVDVEALKHLPILLPQSRVTEAPVGRFIATQAPGPAYIPLSTVAEVQISPGPNQITRENSKRRVVTTFNVRGRDLGSLVAEAQVKIREQGRSRRATGSPGADSSS